MDTPPSITCSSLRISEKEIAQFDRKVKVKWVERRDIVAVTLKYGRTGDHHVRTIIAGIVLMGLGVVLGVVPVVRVILRGDYPAESVTLRSSAFAVPMVLIGFYFMTDLFKRRYYLLVKALDREYKMVFDDRVAPEDLREFIGKARSWFGYNIETDPALMV